MASSLRSQLNDVDRMINDHLVKDLLLEMREYGLNPFILQGNFEYVTLPDDLRGDQKYYPGDTIVEPPTEGFVAWFYDSVNMTNEEEKKETLRGYLFSIDYGKMISPNTSVERSNSYIRPIVYYQFDRRGNIIEYKPKRHTVYLDVTMSLIKENDAIIANVVGSYEVNTYATIKELLDFAREHNIQCISRTPKAALFECIKNEIRQFNR